MVCCKVFRDKWPRLFADVGKFYDICSWFITLFADAMEQKFETIHPFQAGNGRVGRLPHRHLPHSPGPLQDLVGLFQDQVFIVRKIVIDCFFR